jgi:hypothetical protein
MFLIPVSVDATTFWVYGKITRTLVDNSYGGCMVLLDKSIANGCPSEGWVSLDCKNTFYPAGQGDRKFNTALVAAMSGKSVSIVVDNTKKHDGYCVGGRVDVNM